MMNSSVNRALASFKQDGNGGPSPASPHLEQNLGYKPRKRQRGAPKTVPLTHTLSRATSSSYMQDSNLGEVSPGTSLTDTPLHEQLTSLIRREMHLESIRLAFPVYVNKEYEECVGRELSIPWVISTARGKLATMLGVVVETVPGMFHLRHIDNC